jgi:hypothetical protein
MGFYSCKPYCLNSTFGLQRGVISKIVALGLMHVECSLLVPKCHALWSSPFMALDNVVFCSVQFS